MTPTDLPAPSPEVTPGMKAATWLALSALVVLLGVIVAAACWLGVAR